MKVSRSTTQEDNLCYALFLDKVCILAMERKKIDRRNSYENYPSGGHRQHSLTSSNTTSYIDSSDVLALYTD